MPFLAVKKNNPAGRGNSLSFTGYAFLFLPLPEPAKEPAVFLLFGGKLL